MRTALNAAIRMAQKGEKPAPSVRPAPPPPSDLKPVVGVAVRSSDPGSSPPPAAKGREDTGSMKLDEGDLVPDSEPPPPKPHSIPPPVPGPKTFQASPPPPARDDRSESGTTSAGRTSSPPATSEPPPAPAATISPGRASAPPAVSEPPPPPAERLSSLPPPALADDDELALPVAGGMLRTPAGMAAIALVSLIAGWLIGRATAPEPEVAAIDGVAEVASAAAATAVEAADPEPAPEPSVPAPEPEPEAVEPTPLPLRVGALPDDVELLVNGESVDPDAPPSLPVDGSPVRLELVRAEQRVTLSVATVPGSDDGAEPALAVEVLELPESPPEVEEPEPVAAPAPMQARPRPRPTRARRPTPMRRSPMRPTIALDPGF